MFAFQLSSR